MSGTAAGRRRARRSFRRPHSARRTAYRFGRPSALEAGSRARPTMDRCVATDPGVSSIKDVALEELRGKIELRLEHVLVAGLREDDRGSGQSQIALSATP